MVTATRDEECQRRKQRHQRMYLQQISPRRQPEQQRTDVTESVKDLRQQLDLQQLRLTAGIAGGQDLGPGTTNNQNYD